MVETAEQSKLFVGGISRETSEDTLRDHFGKYGEVVGSVIARDRTTGGPRGFGFVSFAHSSSVDRALQDSHLILERTVEVKKAIPRSEQHQNKYQNKLPNRNSRKNDSRTTDQFRTKKIFVGGLAPSLTEEEFKSYFEKFGRIADVVVMHDSETSRPRGFGFITFDSEDAVEDVMQKSFHELTGKLVEVKRAVPREGSKNGNKRYNMRVVSGKDTFDSYHSVNYPHYSLQYCFFPGYGPHSGYVGAAGYPYGASLCGPGFSFGEFNGIGYATSLMAPRSPWNSSVLGIGGNQSTYGNIATVYPAYLNGGVGGMGTDAST
ncbi:heterogeneous nuclear ribonucleoprotein 1-like [Diospyros lotus]|uniref:heterogeneous nuclear ribonucleoprotein 1-like n=1 Tax=Diospyros lotus TaxID=55363 RepID=UPI00225641C6|nr:heterogeneous nuclear ribonucleoprotein 1-like [Diospyros lotus]